MDELSTLLRAIKRSANVSESRNTSENPITEIQQKLKRFELTRESMNTLYTFAVGDIVTARWNMPNFARRPVVGEPALILAIFEPVVTSNIEANTSLYLMQMDCRIAVIDENDDMLGFPFSTQYLMPWRVYAESCV